MTSVATTTDTITTLPVTTALEIPVPVRIYLHVCVCPGAVEVCSEIMNDYILPSGILDTVCSKTPTILTAALHIPEDGALRQSLVEAGPSVVQSLQNLFSHPSCRVVLPNTNILQTMQFPTSDKSQFERPTLLMARKDAIYTDQEYLVLYLHSKGITRAKDTNETFFQNIEQWRRLMSHHLITQWRRVISVFLKNNVDAVGTLFRNKPSPHFSGNFWWSTASLLRNRVGTIGSEYTDPEMWLLSDLYSSSKTRPCAVASLFQFPYFLYGCYIPEDEYKVEHLEMFPKHVTTKSRHYSDIPWMWPGEVDVFKFHTEKYLCRSTVPWCPPDLLSSGMVTEGETVVLRPCLSLTCLENVCKKYQRGTNFLHPLIPTKIPSIFRSLRCSPCFDTSEKDTNINKRTKDKLDCRCYPRGICQCVTMWQRQPVFVRKYV